MKTQKKWTSVEEKQEDENDDRERGAAAQQCTGRRGQRNSRSQSPGGAVPLSAGPACVAPRRAMSPQGAMALVESVCVPLCVTPCVTGNAPVAGSVIGSGGRCEGGCGCERGLVAPGARGAVGEEHASGSETVLGIVVGCGHVGNAKQGGLVGLVGEHVGAGMRQAEGAVEVAGSVHRVEHVAVRAAA
jgi:hypothetical protein